VGEMIDFNLIGKKLYVLGPSGIRIFQLEKKDSKIGLWKVGEIN
jgi:hypothetical protein